MQTGLAERPVGYLGFVGSGDELGCASRVLGFTILEPRVSVCWRCEV